MTKWRPSGVLAATTLAPHFQSWNGNAFDFQGKGVFQAVPVCSDEDVTARSGKCTWVSAKGLVTFSGESTDGSSLSSFSSTGVAESRFNFQYLCVSPACKVVNVRGNLEIKGFLTDKEGETQVTGRGRVRGTATVTGFDSFTRKRGIQFNEGDVAIKAKLIQSSPATGR